ncbi:MAG: hypothetical protein GY757_40215 [bacterium]|nr:hypothetical protein [bacterium]
MDHGYWGDNYDCSSGFRIIMGSWGAGTRIMGLSRRFTVLLRFGTHRWKKRHLKQYWILFLKKKQNAEDTEIKKKEDPSTFCREEREEPRRKNKETVNMGTLDILPRRARRTAKKE